MYTNISIDIFTYCFVTEVLFTQINIEIVGRELACCFQICRLKQLTLHRPPFCRLRVGKFLNSVADFNSI